MTKSLIEVQDTVWERSGGQQSGVKVRCLTLNRLDKANALSAGMMQNLASAVSAQSADLHILRSAHQRLFCAGADIAEFVAGPAALAAQEHALLALIEQFSLSQVPLIAVIRGKASGAGVILAALADVVLASEDAELSCPEIRFGMYPVIVNAVLCSRVTYALSNRMCLGQSLTVEEAWRVGLVSEVMPLPSFDQQVEERLRFFSERSDSLAIARQCRQRISPPQLLLQQVQSVASLMAENYLSKGVRERIAAYLGGLGGGGEILNATP